MNIDEWTKLRIDYAIYRFTKLLAIFTIMLCTFHLIKDCFNGHFLLAAEDLIFALFSFWMYTRPYVDPKITEIEEDE